MRIAFCLFQAANLTATCYQPLLQFHRRYLPLRRHTGFRLVLPALRWNVPLVVWAAAAVSPARKVDITCDTVQALLRYKIATQIQHNGKSLLSWTAANKKVPWYELHGQAVAKRYIRYVFDVPWASVQVVSCCIRRVPNAVSELGAHASRPADAGIFRRIDWNDSARMRLFEYSVLL